MSFLPDNLDLAKHRCTAHESTLAGARALVLDNGVIRLSILPEYGGRICSLFYRPLSLELLATEFIQSQRPGFTVRGGWCAAFPSLLADGEALTHLAWQGEITEQSDDAICVRLRCAIERVSHQLDGQVRVTPGTIDVERSIRLQVGEAAVTVEDVLTNRNVWPASTTWSAVIALRAQAGDRVILPVESVTTQRGIGPSGNELDFGLIVATPFQAQARDLQDGWVGFRPAAAPIDVRITFPRALLPHAVVMAQRNEENPAENAFRLQPMATVGPIADDSRGGALVLQPKTPVRIPLRLELGAGLMAAGAWGRPGLQLAQLITDQRVPTGRLALWRVGEHAVVLKTPRDLILLMPELAEDSLLIPDDLPAADLILCPTAPPSAVLQRLAQRTSARFIGPPAIRQSLRELGIDDNRAIALSPGARFDLPGLGVLAAPARCAEPDDRLGYLLLLEHLSIYHAGVTQYLGEFGALGQQFHPQLVFLPLTVEMSMADSLLAAKLLQPRLAVPMGAEADEREYIKRCRAQHMPFAAQVLFPAEGGLFDGWRLQPLTP